MSSSGRRAAEPAEEIQSAVVASRTSRTTVVSTENSERRRCRPRGVPLPNIVRRSRPKLKALPWMSTRLRMLS